MNLSVKSEDVIHAAQTLRSRVVRTPVLQSDELNHQLDAQVYFKCENLQTVGAFKFRGACYALSQLTESERQRGVIAFSSGNHAQAISKAAAEFNIPSLVVMPADAPQSKIKATRSYGAEVILYDRQREDREAITARLSQERGMVLIPPYNHPWVIAGQGTAALELFEEVGKLDYLFVCVGGGGLLAGSALAAQALSPSCKLVGVEPEAGNDGAQSFEAGRLIKIPVPQTIADGAQTQVLGSLPFEIIRMFVHQFVSVSDQELCRQMKFFVEKMKLVVEPTGCLSAAAVANQKVPLNGKRVGVIVSGGNVDIDRLSQCIQRVS